MNIAQYPKPGQLVKINGPLNGHIRNGFEINDTHIINGNKQMIFGSMAIGNICGQDILHVHLPLILII